MAAPAPAASIDVATVRRLATLARLTVNDAEAAALAADMRKILAHVHSLAAVPVPADGDAELAAPPATPLRPDEVRPGLDLEQALRNAPERLGDGFGVPKILE